MMRVWVNAYYKDDTQILGNCDGQGSITAKNYRLTKMYKHMKGKKQKDFPLWSKPYCWKLFDDGGTFLEKITNPYYKEGR